MRLSNNRRGVTLVELVLVLAILCFLTGIIVTYFPDYKRKARLVANFENIKNLATLAAIHEINSCGTLPNRADSLLTTDASGPSADGLNITELLLNVGGLTSLPLHDPGAASVSAIIDPGPFFLNLAANDSAGGPNFDNPLSLTDDLIRNRGFTAIVDHPVRVPSLVAGTPPYVAGTGASIQTPVNATLFFPKDIRTIDDDTDRVAVINHRSLVAGGGAELLQNVFNIDPPTIGTRPTSGEAYIALGVGGNISFIGNTPGMTHAPVYYPDNTINSFETVKEFYFRFILVYQISAFQDSIGEINFGVKFIGVTRPNDTNSGGSIGTGNYNGTVGGEHGGNNAFTSINVDHDKIVDANVNN